MENPLCRPLMGKAEIEEDVLLTVIIGESNSEELLIDLFYSHSLLTIT